MRYIALKEVCFIFSKNFILYTYSKIYCHCGHKMLWSNVNNTFSKSYNVKAYKNIKSTNLTLCKAAQLPLILCMLSKNIDFGVASFILMNTKFTTMNQKIILYLSAFKSSCYMELFLRYIQISDEKLPLVKIRKNKPKNEISWSQFLITRDIQNLYLDIYFGGWQIRWN